MASIRLDVRYERDKASIRLHAPADISMPGLTGNSYITLYDFDAPASAHASIPEDHPFNGKDTVSAVYRGIFYRHSLLREGESSRGPCVAAFKWARGVAKVERLRTEAEFYAKHLAGSMDLGVVPRCHGYFEGTYNDMSVSCLVLEWHGAVPRDVDTEDELK